MENSKKICCIFNLGPHYNYPLYVEMSKELHCDFYIGDHLPYFIKTFEYNSLPNFKGTLRNKFLHNFYWQVGAIKLLFKPYHTYIMTGEPYCLSHWILLILSKFTKKRMIAWTHGWYGRETTLKKTIKKAFFHLFNHILSYNEYAIQLMEKEGFDRKKMTCIANSLDSDRIKLIRQQLKDTDIFSQHFGNTNPVLIYCGRIQKSKQIDMIIDSIERMNNEDFKVNFVIVGKDVEQTGLSEYVNKKHLQEQVWFYGACYDDAILGELFYNATVCVSPGNVGLTAIHALSFGCPVVTHNNFAYQGPEFEAIIPNYTGDYFQQGNIEDLTNKIRKWAQRNNIERAQTRQIAFKEIERKWDIHQQIKTLQTIITA